MSTVTASPLVVAVTPAPVKLSDATAGVSVVPSSATEGSTPAARSPRATDPSTICEDPTAPAAMVGFGYVPARPPPAGPEGGNVVGMTPAARSAAWIVPSRIAVLVTFPAPIVGFG